MKKKYLAVFLICSFTLVIFAGIILLNNKKITLLQECPDEWIEDRMPTIEGYKSDRQYFIFNGQRKEIKNYDLDWIKNNCSIQVQYVY